MKKFSLNLRRCTVALLPVLAFVPAFGQAAAPAGNEEVVKLPEFTISTTAADPYRSADVMSVSRIAGNILDQPFSVNVVSRQLMNDLGANSTYEVNRYFAGLSSGRGAGIAGIMDRQNFRGFESFSKTVDNFSQFDFPSNNGYQANIDPAFIERQELVMGPDSILSPTGTPGGAVNIITKSPSFTSSTDFTGTVGNYDSNKWTVDSTGAVVPSIPRLAMRIIASYQDAKTYIPGAVRQQNLEVAFAYKFTNTSKLTVKYIGEDWGQRGEATNANDWGEQVYTSDTIGGKQISNSMLPGFGYRRWNGSATWSRRKDRINMLEAEFTTTLFDRISARFAGQGLTDNFLQDAAYPSSNPSDVWDPVTGQVIGVKNATIPTPTPGILGAIDPTSVPTVGQFNHSFWRGFQFQNDYAANFHPGPVSIQPVAGWVFQQGHQIYSYNVADNRAADLPNVNLYANNGAQLVGSSAHPPLSHYTSGYSNQPSMGTLKQLYEVTKVGLYEDRVFLTGGVSRTTVNVDNYKTTTVLPNPTNPTGLGVPGGPYTQVKLISKKDNYLGGVLAKPMKNISLYYTYSSNAGVTASPTNSPLWQTGKQHEFGFKSEFFDQRLAINADHFQIVQYNLATPNPLHNTDPSAPPTLLGNATSKGYELNVIGGVTKNVSVIASYTAMKYRDLFGRRVRNVPDRLTNLLVNYHATQGTFKGASAFFGVVHVGNVAGETITGATALGVPEQPGFYVKGWTVVNAGGSYAWDRYRINLNIDNLFNSKFLWQPASRQSVPGYPGITFRVTFNVHI
ncbi:MAG TPA: TonB-dependent receptor [Opitutaceae bacterium]|nr:TonB-dependent receptor [Opitutaceae bacterium]